MSNIIKVCDVAVEPGDRRRLEIPVTQLPTETWLSIPVEVVNGQRTGPCVWLSGALHGDELNGVEIVRQVLEKLNPQRLRGTVIAVPIVNVPGFMQQSRYLPDRRDLNRSFPGSATGSLASRVAHLFMQEVVSRCTHGIDLHTGSNHRTNLPQIRAQLKDAETRRCAEAFGAPVIMHAETRDGSLRQAATKRGIHVLLYEAGEPLRYNADAIEQGVNGVLRVLSALNMRRQKPKKKVRDASIEVTKPVWTRARNGGLLRLDVRLGQHVTRRQRMGVITDAFGDNQTIVKAPHEGMIIGLTKNPLVNPGDGIVHLARIATPAESELEKTSGETAPDLAVT